VDSVAAASRCDSTSISAASALLPLPLPLPLASAGYMIVLSLCKQDNWRMQKQTSTKLGRHWQEMTL